MCLEGAQQNGAFLYLKTCNSGTNQQFNLPSSGAVTMFADAQFSVGFIASQYGHNGVDIVVQSTVTTPNNGLLWQVSQSTVKCIC